jgi:hypothetical protein
MSSARKQQARLLAMALSCVGMMGAAQRPRRHALHALHALHAQVFRSSV